MKPRLAIAALALAAAFGPFAPAAEPSVPDPRPDPRRLPEAPERPEGGPLARPHLADGGRGRLLQHRLPDRAEGPDRLRPPLRAPHVPGLEEPREDGVHQARPVERRHPERLDALRLHELLRGRAREHAQDRALGRSRPDARPRDHAGQPHEPAGRREERGQGQRPEPSVRRVPVARHAAGRERELVQRAQLLRRPQGPRRGDARGRPGLLQVVLLAGQRRARRDGRLRARDGLQVDPGVLRFHPVRAAPGAPGHLRAAPGEGEADLQAGRAGARAPPSRSRTTRRSATRPSTTRSASSSRSSRAATTAASTRRSSARAA